MRTFVIGDIHGCYDELIELINKINITDDDFILSLGDIVDRGNKSKEVYHFFKNRANSKVLMGNHERKHMNGVLSYAQEIVKLQFKDEYDEFLEWIKSLDYYYETEDAIIVHASLEHDKVLHEQREDVLSGSTSGERYLEKKYAPETYWNEYYRDEKPVIYGHHVVGDNVKIIGKTYGIDTGACHGGYLTAIELPGFKIHQVKSKKDYWEEEQKKWQIDILKSKPWQTMDFNEITSQIAKLSYIEEIEVKEYLKNLQNWLNQLDDLILLIKFQIEKITNDILKNDTFDFTIEANKYSFSRFIFMCKSGKLNNAYLAKTFNTPKSRVDIAIDLGITPPAIFTHEHGKPAY